MIPSIGTVIVPGRKLTKLKTDLTFCYNLQEASGTAAISETGTNNGYIKPQPVYHAAGKTSLHPYSMTFDGSNDYISRSGIGSTIFSYAVWVYSGFSGNGTYSRLFGHTSYYFDIAISGTGYVRIYDGGWRTTGFSIPLNGWHHLVLSKTSTDYKFYCDNTEEYALTRTRTVSGDLWMMSRYTGAETGRGGLVQAAHWTRALDTDDINDLYNNGNGLSHDNW